MVTELPVTELWNKRHFRTLKW